MLEDKEEFSLVLAALLHDVGKIKQRDVINEKHATLGCKFIVELSNIEYDVRRLSSELVKFHHTDVNNADTLSDREKELLRILKSADRDSASHDRDDRDPNEFREDPRMHNIFQYVNLEQDLHEDGKPIGNSMFPLITLESLLSSKFSKSTRKLSLSDISYANLYNALRKNVSEIRLSERFSFISTLDSILLNYTTFVPSAFFYSQPNISLYHHLRLTAAMASVKYRRFLSGQDDDKAILIMGSVSGIQDYIFSKMLSEGVDDKATKRLRGRSFMVRLITDSVVSYILELFKLYQFNVIWEKSDGFLIMLEYTEDNVKKLEEIREMVELGIEKMNRGPRIFISWKNISLAELGKREDNYFSDIISDLTTDLNIRKRKIISGSMRRQWELIAGVESNFRKICKFCGRNEIVKEERCKGCLSEEDIGEKLVKIDALSKYNGSEGEVVFRYGNYVVSYSLQEDIKASEIIKINSFDYKHYNGSYRTILQGNFSPIAGGSVESINNLLCQSRKEIKRCLYLGIAKTDVDNMGLLMTLGIRPLTLSRYASISALMSVFFSVVANNIAREHHIYLIYAGGDDLSAMGSATDVIMFTISLRTAFTDWVRNKQITLSAGLEITDSHFPVRKGVELATDALDEAKSATDKNSLHVFGLTLPWEMMDTLEETTEKINRLLVSSAQSRATLGRSFPSVLLALDAENPYNNKAVRGKRVRIPDAYLTYYLKRNAKGVDKTKIDLLVSDISNSKIFRYIRFIAYSLIIELRRKEYESRQKLS